MTEERWPPLPYDRWKDTYATLHMWRQIVGKVDLAGWDRPALETGDRSPAS